MTLSEWQKNKKSNISLSDWQKAKKVNQEYIDSFISDANSFLKSSQGDYEGVDWKNAASVYDNKNLALQDLNTRADAIRTWMSLNRNKLPDDSYKSLNGYLDTFRSGGSSILDAFKGAKDYYSQYGEDYWKHHDVLKAEDYEQFSQAGSQVANPSTDDDITWYARSSGIKGINNMVTFAESNKDFLDKTNSIGLNDTARLAQIINSHMTDEEKGIYNYYIGKGDTEGASAYLDSLKDVFNQRQGAQMAEEIKGNKVYELLFGVIQGLDQFSSSVGNIDNFIMGTEPDPPTPIQYASGTVRDDMDGLWGIAYDLVSTTSNMLPSILAGGGVGLATLGASAVGSGYAEMRNLGYDEWQSRGYGALVGASEATLQHFLGGISKLGGKVSNHAVSKFVSSVDNAFARTAITLGGSMASEGLEEAIQTAIEPAFKALVTGEDYNAAEWEDILYSALLGSLTAGVLEGAPTIAGTVINSNRANKLYGDAPQDLVTEALEIDPDNAHAQRLQARLNDGKKVSGYQLNRLLETNEQALLKKDKAKIKSAVEARLTELGEKGDVGKLADVLVKQASGENLSISEKNLIKQSKYGKRITNELSPDNIESGNYTSNWAESIGTERMNAEAYNKGISNHATKQTDATVDMRTVDMTENQLQKENVTESKFKASADGSTKLGDLEVSIKEIAKVKDGVVSLRLEDGSIVDARDVDFSSNDEVMLYETVADMNLNAATANVFIKNYDPNMSAEDYALGFREAYKYGEYSFPMQEMSTEGFSALLSESQKILAYKLGKTDAKYKAEEKQKAVTEKASATASKKGSVRIEKGVRFEKQHKKTIALARCLAKAIGIDIVFYDARTTSNENGKGANGYFDGSTDTIYLDLQKASNDSKTIVFTLSHELVHFIKKWSPKKYVEFAEFLMEQYAEHGVSSALMLKNKMADLDTTDADLAYEELVADACETLLLDSNAVVKLMKLKNKDLDLFEKIKLHIRKLLNNILEAYKNMGYQPSSDEARALLNMKDTVEKIHAMFEEAAVDATQNYQSMQGTTYDAKSDVKKQIKKEGTYEDYDKPITQKDVEVLQSIGRKSINKFTPDEIKKTQKWAHKFYKELGTKSPFFRAWFGEWRTLDPSPIIWAEVDTISINTELIHSERGSFHNDDTKWNIVSGSLGESETKRYARGDKVSIKMLASMKKILESAILIDTEISSKDSNKKHLNTLFMHKFYAPVKYNGENYVAKINVEEYFDQSDDKRRFYHLEGIKIEPIAKRFAEKTASLNRADIDSITSISDLFEFVKRKDKNYVSAPEVNKNLLNEDGTPKVFYHGTYASFTEFKPEEIAEREGSYFFAENCEDAAAYGHNIYKVYLSGRNLANYDNQPTEFYRLKNKREQVKWLKDRGYDGWYADMDSGGWGEISVFSSEQIKSATDNIGTFDKSDSNILHQKKKTTNRSLLANALESTAQNDIEKKKLEEYKSKIALMDSEQAKLSEIRAKIQELSFAKGKRDTEEIKKLRFEANAIANRINIYDKQLLRLESATALKGVLERETKAAYKRAEQKGKEALAAAREKAVRDQRALMTHYQESRKKNVDGRNKTAMRHKIKSVVNDLNQYLLKGTKAKHVPIELQKAVAEALDAVNMDTVGAEERIAKKQDEMRIAKSLEKMQELSQEIEHIQEMGGKMKEKLSNLKIAYDSIITSKDPIIANSHDDFISDTIVKVIEVVGETPLRDMSLYQLETVYDMYKMVLTSVQNANKAFKAKKSEEISVIANRVMEEMDGFRKKKDYRTKTAQFMSELDWNNLKPVYAFERIGSKTLTEVFNSVRAGEDTWAVDVTEAKDFALEQRKKFKYDSWDFTKRYGFTSSSGKQFELSLDQIMSLYAYSKREQARDHLKKGGIVFDQATDVNIKNKLGFSVNFNPTEATAYNLSDETLTDIIGKLTTEQKEFVDAMQDYLSTVMGDKGNEVSLALYGIKLYKEKNYFPLKSATQFMAKAKEQQQGEVKIKNSGFSKETVSNASNPIVLTPFMDVWANHVNDMSMYHAFVLPLEDFYRVYSYKTPTSDTMATESVEMFLQNAHGEEATQYIDRLLKDLNGGARVDSTVGAINKLTGIFKKSAVYASLSVVIQQPSAIARATALVDMKYFVDKPSKTEHKETWAEVKKYAPIAIIKEMGYFDTGMGKSTVDWIKGKNTWKDKVDEAASKAPALADELAWCGIWKAIKRETLHTHKELNPNSEEFLKAVGERFTEVITKTQVYDSVLARSANMRSKDTGMKMATAFMGEPTTSINMLENALIQAKRGDKIYARRAVGGVVSSMILNSILVSLIYAARDDDDEKTYSEKYIGALTDELIDGINPLTMIPFAKDIVSTARGYDVGRSDMTIVSDIIKAWNNLDSDTRSVYRKIEDFVGSIASLLGLPVKNLMRDARSIYNIINSLN